MWLPNGLGRPISASDYLCPLEMPALASLGQITGRKSRLPAVPATILRKRQRFGPNVFRDREQYE